MPKQDTQFRKGRSGNPSGRPKIPPAVKNFKAMTYQQFLDALQKIGQMTREEMLVELERPDATMFEHLFNKIVVDAAEGKKDARELLIERLWGKVKEEIRHHLPEPTYIEFSDGRKIILGAETKAIED